MKKINFKIVILILFIVAISGIQFLYLNSLKTGIINTETLIVVQKNQHNIEENILKFDLKLNTRMDELFLKTMDQIISIKSLKQVIESKGISEVKELKDLFNVYLEQVEKHIAAERLLVLKETVESDFLIQALLDQGFSRYRNKDFTEALKIYKEILDMDSKNKKAICYFYASLYYQNPGDSTHYSDIKTNLSLLLEIDVLTKEEELTLLNILKGISLEEGE